MTVQSPAAYTPGSEGGVGADADDDQDEVGAAGEGRAVGAGGLDVEDVAGGGAGDR
ncbi:hypothetical protein [Streptomyces sp. NPDC058678]|uniref:hypothetical protein n=1 Tax=Streptomyces sp. NPDC058678 TaxID=3346595 RepID=UPI003659BA88